MKTAEIRRKFLEFFASKNHSVLPSDSLVPKDDPTVLFTTAGMQQFKKQFLGQLEGFTRAATSQKCLRTDDLDEVGKTAFHHTFFEMLGNFSFGDYFKKDAIAWGWEFLTRIIAIPQEKLWVSVYKDDREAEDIWIKEIKIDPKKLVRLGDKSNFWPSEAKQKGPNGPCGPCSEIFYDYGENVGCQKTGCNPDCSCGRFAEIWNLVFTQFNRKDGGELEPLPAKNIDTGMGLERLAAVAQGKPTNFEIDLFEPIFSEINTQEVQANISLSKREKNIIADHIRAIVFGIADGVVPSNEGRGYVMKRLITDITDIVLEKGDNSFIYKLVPAVVTAMKDTYENLVKKQNNIATWIQKTEEGYKKVRKERIPELKKEAQTNPSELGRIIFKYRDTYGLTLAAANSTLLSIDIPEEAIKNATAKAEELMDQQREKSRAASKMTGDVFMADELNLNVAKTNFLDQDEAKVKILKLFIGNTDKDRVSQGDEIKIVMDKTPFYAESGGQMGDTGVIESGSNLIEVTQTQKISGVFVHVGTVKKGSFKSDETVLAKIDKERRMAIMRNHTGTHLLQAALRQVLGSHVQQQGSLVAKDRLRFDFTHPKALKRDELIEIEDIVNRNIRTCTPIGKKEMPLAEAQKQGALAFFAEKYNQKVRVVSMGEFSKELCGGTHLNNTGEVGLLKIISESAIAQGIRRLEATTGDAALKMVHDAEQTLEQVAQALKAPVDEVAGRLEAQQKRIKQIQKQLSESKLQEVKSSVVDIIAKSKTVKGVKIVSHVFDSLDVETLKRISDLIKQKTKSAVIALAAKQEKNAFVVVSVTDDLIKKNIKANDIIEDIAPMINGSGGGRPTLAQAGSKDVKDLNKALDEIENIVKGKFNS
ncbi:MAG: alanine--tRNA ligase [Candidatus Aceula meridiana]|nr:alanine--tRNA ligase [Candidatus Aceula meridiana]